jgi:hypothetical protein
MLKGMRRVIGVVVAVVAVAAMVIAGSGYLVGGLVASQKETLLGLLRARAGVEVGVDEAEFDVASWYQLRPAIRLTGVRVGNPPGFGEPQLLTAGACQLRLALKPLLRRRMEIESLVLKEPRVMVERNRQGVSNLEVFAQGIGRKEAGGGKTGAATAPLELGIGSLGIEGGELRMAQGAVSRIHDIRLEMRGIGTGEAAETNLTARLFAGERSQLRFEGVVGPFEAGRAPVDGQWRLTLALADVEAGVVGAQWGELVAPPDEGAVLEIGGPVKGDLYSLVSATGQLSVRGLKIGRDPAARLPFEGNAQFAASIRKLMSTPVSEVKLREAVMKLGEGEWNGAVDLVTVGGVVRGRSTGSIAKLDIDQFLRAFAGAGNRVSGELLLRSYELRFGGRDAAGFRQSLNGQAELTVVRGRLRALDLVAAIRRAAERTGLEEASRLGDTEFTTLNTSLTLAGGRIQASNLIIEGPALGANGSGEIGAGGELDFRLTTLVRGPVAQLLEQRPVGSQPAEAAVPVEITGTIEAPRVMPNVKAMAVATGLQYLQDLVKKRFGKKP